MSKKSNKGIGACVYCGRSGPITFDHTPPQCIFSNPKPKDLIKVPSCRECNEQYSKDDEYFKRALTLRYETHEHPEIQKLLPSVWRSFQYSEARGMKKAFGKGLLPIDLFTPAGIYLGKTGAFRVNNSRINREVERIGKGIFYWKTKGRIPEGYIILVLAMDFFDNLDETSIDYAIPLIAMAKSGERVRLGDGNFTFWFKASDEDPNTAVIRMLFFETVWFLCLISRDKKSADVTNHE